jgi:hypothetical protein
MVLASVSVSVRKVSVLELGLVQNLREGELLVLELASGQGLVSVNLRKLFVHSPVEVLHQITEKVF